MDEKNGMIVLFLLFVLADAPAEGHVLDVCASCHANATCEDKSDGSGKVCNCKYGFVGNGRTFCQDKNECQIGAHRICGQHTTCHNTMGSYFCTCLAGYSPSNNMTAFIPNDGTHCQDIDECRITGFCGDGGQCRNLEGSYECSCQLGYRVQDGTEPFHPPREKASCRVVDCGPPASAGAAVLLSVTGTTYGSVAVFACDEGFVWTGGDNSSVCGADGLWTGPTAVCEEVDCGVPPPIPHSVRLWDNVSTVGSRVVYQCDAGYRGVGEGNVSVCAASGKWDAAPLHCQEISCQAPFYKPHAKMLWDGTSHVGSVVYYQCEDGYRTRSRTNSSTCGGNGLWEDVDFWCEEVDCGPPPALPHTRMQWSKSSRMGAAALYQCVFGYHNVGRGNTSVCTATGRWETPAVLCQETSCGSPPVVGSAEQVWDGTSAPGSTALYFCKEGFYERGGHNVSVCSENGQWTLPTLRCQEISCGEPHVLPHAGQVWNGSSSPGSTITYYCKNGFYHSEGKNTSLCSVKGYWTEPNISCKEVDCGVPPPIPHSVRLWDNVSTVGSRVVYQCDAGYRGVGEGNVSFCAASGKWDAAPLHCQEISCQAPFYKPHAKMLWDGTSHVGSVVYYQCEDGYRTRSRTNSSTCGGNGLWEDVDFWCEEISCGPPLSLPRTKLLWDGSSSSPGSVVLYECADGFYRDGGSNVSTCLRSGEWGKVSVRCQAKCGPVPFLAHSEVAWHNGSVVMHRCVSGYHSWRGSGVSVCGSSGLWRAATLRCIEIKPPIDQLLVLNEKCLRWRAEKYEEDTEVYKVTYTGSRDYQRSFQDKRQQLLRSSKDQPELCLNLLPVTNYSISITALSARFTATITTNTSLQAPVVYYREFETPVPTLRLRRSVDTLDPISRYQVFVIPAEGVVMFDCSDPSSKIRSSAELIAAQIEVGHVGTEMDFTVGDGLRYGGFFNAPLKDGRDYYIILRAVSQWKTALKSSCVLWAKVRGTSYVLRVSSLSAAAAVGLVAVVIVGGYSLTWFFKKSWNP